MGLKYTFEITHVIMLRCHKQCDVFYRNIGIQVAIIRVDIPSCLFETFVSIELYTGFIYLIQKRKVDKSHSYIMNSSINLSYKNKQKKKRIRNQRFSRIFRAICSTIS
jgi:hypothetical protein